jgi:drug/metabolite transporter (DMT)-like permease
LVVAALVALFVFDVSWLFWMLAAASLVIAAIDFWQKRRLGQ